MAAWFARRLVDPLFAGPSTEALSLLAFADVAAGLPALRDGLRSARGRPYRILGLDLLRTVIVAHFAISETGFFDQSLHDQYLALFGGPGSSQL
jgi:hypothetical protein